MIFCHLLVMIEIAYSDDADYCLDQTMLALKTYDLLP